jgi:hypothetical protein
MLEVARRDEERLRLYYESNVGLFSTSPTWRLRRLRLFLDEAAGVTMARLEEAAAARSGPTLDELRAELGGEIDELGPATLAELRLREPKLPHLIAPLAVGRLSPPYRTESTLDIVVPLERTEAEPLPFAEVHERVAAAWVEQYTREAYRELADEILAGAELEIRPEGLATLRDGGLELPDPSVEELDALLSEL